MQVDVSFDFAKVYDVNKIDVVKGEKFTLNTDLLSPATSDWFSDNDAVLTVNQKGNNATLSADSLGTSTILIMDSNQIVLKKLTIKVVDTISPVITDLGLSADAPVSK